MSRLPGLLEHVEAVAGTAAALELAKALGGVRISISARPGSTLVKHLGPEVAAALVARLGRGEMFVPMATVRGQKGRRAGAAQMLAKGVSVSQAALACDIHERTAWRLKAAIGEAETRGLDLFAPRPDQGPDGDAEQG
jgi:hypothetical protein